MGTSKVVSSNVAPVITLLHSTNGGRTWKNVKTPLQFHNTRIPNRIHINLAFHRSGHGVIIGYLATLAGYTKPQMYGTTNLGATWKQITVPTPPGLRGSGWHILDLKKRPGSGYYVIDSMVPSAGSAPYDLYLYHHKAWTKLGQGGGEYYSNLSVISQKQLYLTGSNPAVSHALGEVQHSLNGGVSWHKSHIIPNPGKYTLARTQFVSSGEGWSLTHTVLLHTSNKGRNWSVITRAQTLNK